MQTKILRNNPHISHTCQNWCSAADCHVGSVMIVSLQPAGCKILYCVKRLEQVMSPIHIVPCGCNVQRKRSDAVVQAENLMRIPRRRPSQGHYTDVLRAVIITGDQWFTTPFNDPVNKANHPFRWRREVNLNTKSLAVVVVCCHQRM